MKVQMRKSRVLLRHATEDLTEGGIQKSVDGFERDIKEVFSVGEGVEDVKPGDKVLVNHMTVKEVEIDGEKYGVCLDDAIYGIVGQGEVIPKQVKAQAKASNIITPSGIIY